MHPYVDRLWTKLQSSEILCIYSPTVSFRWLRDIVSHGGQHWATSALPGSPRTILGNARTNRHSINSFETLLIIYALREVGLVCLFFFTSVHLFLRVWAHSGVSQCTHGCRLRVGSLLPSHGSREMNSRPLGGGHQAWQQAPLWTEPSRWPFLRNWLRETLLSLKATFPELIWHFWGTVSRAWNLAWGPELCDLVMAP